MRTVGDCARHCYAWMKEQGVNCTLEWNLGNHFKEPGLRTAKAFAWVMNHMREKPAHAAEKRNMKKPENFCWQEGDRCGILLKLSLRGAAVELKNGLKRTKKFLTNRFQFDIINKLFRKRRRSEKFDFWKICFKNFEKSFKKFLTNEKRSDIINKLSMRQHPKPSEDKMLTHFVYLGRFPYEIDTRCNFPLKAKENCTL